MKTLKELCSGTTEVRDDRGYTYNSIKDRLLSQKADSRRNHCLTLRYKDGLSTEAANLWADVYWERRGEGSNSISAHWTADQAVVSLALSCGLQSTRGDGPAGAVPTQADAVYPAVQPQVPSGVGA